MSSSPPHGYAALRRDELRRHRRRVQDDTSRGPSFWAATGTQALSCNRLALGAGLVAVVLPAMLLLMPWTPQRGATPRNRAKSTFLGLVEEDPEDVVPACAWDSNDTGCEAFPLGIGFSVSKLDADCSPGFVPVKKAHYCQAALIFTQQSFLWAGADADGAVCHWCGKCTPQQFRVSAKPPPGSKLICRMAYHPVVPGGQPGVGNASVDNTSVVPAPATPAEDVGPDDDDTTPQGNTSSDNTTLPNITGPVNCSMGYWVNWTSSKRQFCCRNHPWVCAMIKGKDFTNTGPSTTQAPTAAAGMASTATTLAPLPPVAVQTTAAPALVAGVQASTSTTLPPLPPIAAQTTATPALAAGVQASTTLLPPAVAAQTTAAPALAAGVQASTNTTLLPQPAVTAETTAAPAVAAGVQASTNTTISPLPPVPVQTSAAPTLVAGVQASAATTAAPLAASAQATPPATVPAPTLAPPATATEAAEPTADPAVIAAVEAAAATLDTTAAPPLEQNATGTPPTAPTVAHPVTAGAEGAAAAAQPTAAPLQLQPTADPLQATATGAPPAAAAAEGAAAAAQPTAAPLQLQPTADPLQATATGAPPVAAAAEAAAAASQPTAAPPQLQPTAGPLQAGAPPVGAAAEAASTAPASPAAIQPTAAPSQLTVAAATGGLNESTAVNASLPLAVNDTVPVDDCTVGYWTTWTAQKKRGCCEQAEFGKKHTAPCTKVLAAELLPPTIAPTTLPNASAEQQGAAAPLNTTTAEAPTPARAEAGVTTVPQWVRKDLGEVSTTPDAAMSAPAG